MSNLATEENTVDHKTIIITKPIMARRERIGELFGLSTATVRRYLDEADQIKGFEDLYYQTAHNITIIDIEAFRRFLKLKHKKYL